MFVADNAVGREYKCSRGAGLHAQLAVNALLSRVEKFLVSRNAFRIVTPFATQRTALREERDADARAIVDGVSFQVEE